MTLAAHAHALASRKLKSHSVFLSNQIWPTPPAPKEVRSSFEGTLTASSPTRLRTTSNDPSTSLVLCSIKNPLVVMSANCSAAGVNASAFFVLKYTVSSRNGSLSLCDEQLCSVLSRATTEWSIDHKNNDEHEVLHKTKYVTRGYVQVKGEGQTTGSQDESTRGQPARQGRSHARDDIGVVGRTQHREGRRAVRLGADRQCADFFSTHHAHSSSKPQHQFGRLDNLLDWIDMRVQTGNARDRTLKFGMEGAIGVFDASHVFCRTWGVALPGNKLGDKIQNKK
jgi:hypothetical protein